MRVHVPGPRPRDEGEFEVRVNPGDATTEPFAIIALDELSATQICLDDLDDARRLVRAAVKALHQLEASVKGEPHLYSDDNWRCGVCGQTRGADIHAEDDDARPLTAKGEAADDYGAKGKPWCPAKLTDPGTPAVYCELRAGHEGAHRAPGDDEGDPDITWGDKWTPEPSGMQSPRPADRCKCGHIALYHHLNQVVGELQHCNECPGVDDCAAYSPAAERDEALTAVNA